MERNPLNDNEIDGNVMNIPLPDQDLYHCWICDGDVPEGEWNSKRKCCYSCWWKI